MPQKTTSSQTQIRTWSGQHHTYMEQRINWLILCWVSMDLQRIEPGRHIKICKNFENVWKRWPVQPRVDICRGVSTFVSRCWRLFFETASSNHLPTQRRHCTNRSGRAEKNMWLGTCTDGSRIAMWFKPVKGAKRLSAFAADVASSGRAETKNVHVTRVFAWRDLKQIILELPRLGVAKPWSAWLLGM